MKLSVMVETLLPALTIASRCVSKRTTLPILTNVRLEADAGTGELVIDATNLSVWARVTVPAKVEGGGATTVGAADLLAIAKIASREATHRLDISLDKAKERLSIETGDAKRGLPGLDAGEYPVYRQTKKPVVVRIQTSELLRAVGEARHCIADTDVRPILTGMSMKVQGSVAEFCAADNFRLAVTTAPVLKVKGEFAPIVLRYEFIEQLAKLLPDVVDEEVDLLIDRPSNLSMVHVEIRPGRGATTLRVSLAGALIDGSFPNYLQVMPRMDQRSGFTVNRARFSNAVKGAKSIGPLSVKLTFAKDGLTVSAHDSDGRTFESTIPGEFAGEPGDVSVNDRYLADVDVLPEPEVIFWPGGRLAPILLTPAGRGDFTEVIMPVRTT